ncbi:MAG: class I SAM-dependent methyltransferase [Planctomycetota bacterium]
MTNGVRLQPDPRFGFLRVQPTPSPDEIARYYAETFYSNCYGRYNTAGLPALQRDAEFQAGRLADLSAAMSVALGRPLSGATLLDVGCGYGHVLQYFHEQGLRGQGVDAAPAAVEHARAQGLDVQLVLPGRLEAVRARFDIVLLLDVLQHLPDPVDTLTEIHERLLQPGGLLVLEVPNNFNGFQLAARALHGLPEWWVAPPAHLSYFNADTLRALLAGTGYALRSLTGSFPMELFLLMGENYVGDPALGAECHRRRVAFESNLRAHGGTAALRDFSRALGEAGLGRTLLACATRTAPDAPGAAERRA